jgi:hypothetical protein
MLTESYRKRLLQLSGILFESKNSDDEELNSLVYSNEDFLNNNEKFKKYFKGININDFKNYKFPKNDSEKIKEEIIYINKLKVDDEFIKKHDNIYSVFKEYFELNHLDFPKILIKDLMEASAYFIMKIKNYYNRPRPYQVAKKINIELKPIRLNSAKSAAFPSGHSAQSHLLSYILSDLFPKHKSNFEKIANNVCKSRMMAKVHFPSDIENGEKIAKILFKQYKNNNF